MAGLPALAAALLFLLLEMCTAGACHAQSAQAPYRLIGTISGTARSSAVIDDKTAGQSVYHEQELLPDGSRLERILSDRITLVRSDGTVYDLYINSASQVENLAAPAADRDQRSAAEQERIERQQRESSLMPTADPDRQRLRSERKQNRRQNRSHDE